MDNNINRKLVKEQARKYISKKVLPLFIITLVVYLLVSASTIYSGINDIDDLRSGVSIADYYDFTSPDGDIDDFESLIPTPGKIIAGSVSGLLAIMTIIFSPLNVTLTAMYVMLIRRSYDEAFEVNKEMGTVFKTTFNSSYFRKLIIVYLRGIIMGLLCILFIVPGIVYKYSTYFSYQLLCDYPSLKPSEALALSKKITKGNRTELFVMNLSFIGWLLLAVLSFGIIGIYVTPYKCTVDALYYENFRIRAIQEGRVTKFDFMTASERYAALANEQQNQTSNQ